MTSKALTLRWHLQSLLALLLFACALVPALREKGGFSFASACLVPSLVLVMLMALRQGALLFAEKRLRMAAADSLPFFSLPLVPLALTVLVFLPFDFPQNWNTHSARLKTLLWAADYLSVLTAGCLLVRIIRRHYGESVHCVPLRLFFITVFLLAALLGLRKADRSLSGDEIGYYNMTQSLARDVDINLDNNMDPAVQVRHSYLFQGDTLADYGSIITRMRYTDVFFHGGPVVHDPGRWRIYFPAMPGAPFGWALPYRMGGHIAVLIFQTLLVSLLLLLLFVAGQRAGWPDWTSAALSGGLLLTAPILFYMHSYWVEATGAFLTLAGISGIRSAKSLYRAGGWLALSLLCWVHIRFAVIPIAALATFLLSRNTEGRAKTLAAVIVLAVMLPVLPFNKAHSGTFLPSPGETKPSTRILDSLQKTAAGLTSAPESSPAPVAAVSVLERFSTQHEFLKNLLRPLVSGRYGLFLYNPLMVLGLLGLFFLPRLVWAPAAAYIALVLLDPGIDEGHIPPRYFTAIMPLLFLGLGAFREHANLKRWLFGLSLLSLAIAAFGFAYPVKMAFGLFNHAWIGISLKPGFTLREVLACLGWAAVAGHLFYKSRFLSHGNHSNYI
ncbi:MAG: hypothetical protein V1913_14150 [Fibrobacterota bacterium]